MIFDTGSLTESAERLHITQPAISHSLRKLREFYNDPIFVRSGGKMLPTKLASDISLNFKKAEALMLQSLQFKDALSPETFKKILTIGMSDMAQTYFLPPLCLLLESELDGLEIHVEQHPQSNLEKQMRLGEVDIAIGHMPQLAEDYKNISQQRLFADRLVCMVRDGHPITTSTSQIRNFKSLKMLEVRNRSTGHGNLISLMTKRYFSPPVVSISSYTAAPQIIEGTDLAVVIPHSIAQRYNADSQFILFELNDAENLIDISLYYHCLFKGDDKVQWLKNLITEHFHEEK